MGNFDRTRWFYSVCKMDISIWLSVLIAVIALGTPATSSEPRVVCYYTNWSVYRPGTARFNPQNINPYLCTHLIYAFGGFTKENSLKPFDKYQDIEKGGYAKFTGLKTYNKNLKTLLAIGGWNEGSSRFSPMVASRERRKEFVRNAIKFLRQNRFDGLDLDWEYPAFRDGGKPKDRDHYAKLVKELREEFEAEAEKTGKPRLLLTMAVPAGIEYIQKGYDVKTLNKYLDWMNLLTYDYHSAFEPAVNHHAPLYPLEEPNEYSVDGELNIDYTIKFYLEQGADPGKLVLGIPTYGRSYTLFNPDAVELGSPADGPGEQGDATREKGYLAYYEICEAIKPKSRKRSPTSDEESSEEYDEKQDQPWTVMHPNSAAMGPVAYKGNQWVGYDDEDIVRKKAEYVAENNLGGIMFWSIDNDDFRGSCHGKPYPLIEAAKEAYYAKLGSNGNIQTTRAPINRSSNKKKPRPRITTTTSTTTTTTKKPTTANSPSTSNRLTSTTPAWSINTPEPPTTPDPGSDFKCVDEGFFPHPRDCKKYFWCLDSGPSNLGIVAHQFTCPSGLYFNKAADSCDFARNVPCKKPAATTKGTTTKSPTTTTVTTTTTTTTTRKPFLSTKNSVLFRTSSTSTTTTPTPKVQTEEDSDEDQTDEDSEDPRVIKELIELIRKVGGIEQLEKQLHFSEQSASTDGLITTTPSNFNKVLYKKVLDRTRGRNKLAGNSLIETLTKTVQTNQNSRRGPQNAGLEDINEKEKPVRRERPQYVTINRQRASTTTATPDESEEDYEVEEDDFKGPQSFKAQHVEGRNKVATTARTLQYVNIRRGKPNNSGTADIADDTASRNALFERQEPLVAIAETGNAVDALSFRRDSKPEYVTIRRQRPSVEETTTQQYQVTEEEDQDETLLEREISSRPKYNTIVRSQTALEPQEPTPRAPVFKIYTLQTDAPAGPDPTTVLAVQISSLLNSPNSSDTEDSDIEIPIPVTEEESTTISTITSTSTTTTTPLPLPRRTTISRRRGTTVKTTTAPTSSTQVSPRTYTIVRRQRPLRGQNEITSDSNDTNNAFRKIRSTTPNSREVDNVNETVPRRYRGRFLAKQIRTDDSVPAEASPIASGQFRTEDAKLDEEITFTPVEIQPQFKTRQRFGPGTERRFRRPLTSSNTASGTTADSELSAATLEARRPGLVARGRNRFTLSFTTDTSIQSTTAATLTPRRPTFARFSPRPFTRPSPSPPDDSDEEINEEAVTQRSTLRLPFGRTRSTPSVVARKLPFPSRQSTTQQTLVSAENESDNDEPESRADDILLSESAREEKEHDDTQSDLEEEEVPKRKVIIKKLRAPDSTENVLLSTETVPINTDVTENGRKRFRVIRRRPSSTTTIPEPIVSSETPTAPGLQRIRKIIRKKIRPTELKLEATTESVDHDTFISPSAEVFNYGEKTKTPYTTTTTEAETEPIIEQVTEFYKEGKKSVADSDVKNVEPLVTLAIVEQITERIVNAVQQKEVDEIAVETTAAPHNNNNDLVQPDNTTLENIKKSSETNVENKSSNERDEIFYKDVKPEEDVTKSENLTNIKKEKISKVETENKIEITIASEEKGDVLTNKETSTSEIPVVEYTAVPETTTTTSTVSTTPSSRTRSPYRPRKKLFTSSTESSVPSTSKTFSRKYNPGVYTSPASVDRPQFKLGGTVTRRPFSSKVFTRRPFTQKTTQKIEEEEYSDEISEAEEPDHENPFVFVPANQLFTRKPDSTEDDDEADNSEELLQEGEGDENIEEDDDQEQSKFSQTTRKPGFRSRVVNSNTFRTSTTTTELPKRLATSQNRTGIISRFGNNKLVTDKKRVQNVPLGYNSSVSASKTNGDVVTIIKTETQLIETSGVKTTTVASVTETATTTIDDDYLTATALTNGKQATIFSDVTTVNLLETETTTDQMEIDDSTNDYLEFIEGTTNYPTIQDIVISTQNEPEYKTTLMQNAITNTIPNTEVATEQFITTTSTTTSAPPVPAIIKTQFNKLFSVSRVVEVNSKLEKHRLNKNNETTLIEEGKVMIEKKPVIDKIGEVSRYSLIKIFEDEIPIYLTKLGHVYPVDHPPDNIIRIDEARNARALNDNLSDVPKENLIASESVNEAYRHIKEITESKGQERKSHIEHVPNDQFLTYVNDENKYHKDSGSPSFAQWQFVPAAYENEKIRAAKSFEVITPRTMLTNPSTLSLEGLFKTENPFMARKISDDDKKVNYNNNQPFVIYSDIALNQKDDSNVDNQSVLKPETGHGIITFAKGLQFNGGFVKEETITKGPVYEPIYTPIIINSKLSSSSPSSANISSTTTAIVATTTEKATSPILDLLSTTVSTTDVTSLPPGTTETAFEDTTTTKISPVDAKRAKFGFPRRPLIKPSNFTRPTLAPRTVKINNATVTSNLNQKSNKTAFSPSKSRLSANRVQNVPVDLKKKSSTPKVVPKTFSTSKVYTTESPKTTTERKLYFKPNRPSFRPSFFPRKTTPAPTTGDT